MSDLTNANGRNNTTRRAFLQSTSAAMAALSLSPGRIMAGPFDKEDWGQFIPTDKKLHPDWVKALFERGAPTTYSKSRGELSRIGMPVGGLCCGMLYLGGDGKLWNWDIFNQKTEGVDRKSTRLNSSHSSVSRMPSSA